MDIITAAELASYLRSPDLATDPALAQIVDLTNDLISDEWGAPVDPIPVKVRLLALNVSARAWSWDPSIAHLESVTRGLDDATRTERYRSVGNNGSVYLTTDERDLLRGRSSVRSVRLVKPGDLT